MFRMYVELGKKEIETNEKLIIALEKCDRMQREKEQLQNQLDDMMIFYVY